jgi:hypothetical protein
VTIRDIRAIHTLYYFHRYIPSSIARLYGYTPKYIIDILHQKQNETVIAETECQICSMDECQPYYIDGDKTNNKPQNIIQLCEPDKRRFQHMQLKRRNGVLTPQLESSPA